MEVTNKDLFDAIQNLVKKTEDIQKQNDSLKEELKQEIKSIKSELTLEIERIKEENDKLKKENLDLERRLSQTEKKLKKYNLVLYGLKEANTPVEDIQSVLDIITNKLKINCQFSDIRDVYRLGKPEQQKVRPVATKCFCFPA